MLAIVTGASSGLGKDFSYLLSEKGYDLIICARSKNALIEIKNDLESKYHNHVEVVSCDLSIEEDVLMNYTKNMKIDLLVNNAGFGDFGEFIESDITKLENMVDLNIKSLMKLTHFFAGKMKNEGTGKILNVSSIAAFQPGPFMSAYYATKAFVLSLSEGIDYELKPYGVRVSALCPPPTKTKFFDNAGASQSKVLSLTKSLESSDVVKYGYKKMMKNKRVIVPGFGYRLLIFFERFIPRGLVLRIMGKIQGKRKDTLK